MEIATARYDTLALLYMLVDSGVPTNVRMALQRAVDGTWAETAQDWAAYDAQTESLADAAVDDVCNLQIL